MISFHSFHLSDQVCAANGIADVDIWGSWAETWRDESFVLDQTTQSNHVNGVIFSTDNDLFILSECDKIFVDGTFKSTPHPFKQIFTIHGMYMDHVIHLATCLLEGKRTDDYLYSLSAIKRKIQQLTGIPWQPTEFICDFEQAIIAAVEWEFPLAAIDGCYFHYTKSLWKRIGELGLIHAYKNDQMFKEIIRKIMALGFLPLNFVSGVFNVLRNSGLVNHRIRLYPGLQNFFDYVQNTYILPNSNFPPHRWNLWHRDMNTRTNNIVESFNNALNSAVMVRHPSIWLFIRHLKDFHATSQIQIRNANRGVPRPTRRRKWRQIEQNLLRLKAQYINGQRSLNSYWKNVCYYIKDFLPRR